MGAFRACGLGLALFLATACLADKGSSHALVFVHATDPHLFVPAAQDSDKDTKARGDRQENLNQKALTDMLQRIPGLSSSGQTPAFLVLTGDFGVDPCEIPKPQPAPPTPTTGQDKGAVKPTPPTSQQCVDSADPAKRDDQITRLSKALGASTLKEIYLVAGNNDVAHEDPDSVSLGYFNQFIDDLQKKLNDDKTGVQLHNLTACYAGTGGSSSCFADVADGYRLIGFPSYSFKNEGGKSTNNDEQAKQFEMFRSLLDQAKQAGKQVLVLSHIPEIDDPYVLAQDRYDGKSPAPADDKDPKNPRSIWSAWNVSVKLLDGWKEMLNSDTVAAVLAGHLHDSHKEIYRRPYTWSTVDDHRLGFRKLFLAPPLAVKNQDTSPIQARGFSVVTLQPNHIEALLYWYNQETGEFKSDAAGFEHLGNGHLDWWRLPRFVASTFRWIWRLDTDDSPLIRLGVLLIALLTAFLTVVAVWNIPATDNPLAPAADKSTSKSSDAQPPASPTAVPSPFASNFGKTVIGGFTGLAVTEVAKAIGGQSLTGDATTASSRWLYIVCFIFFFFLLLVSLGLLRGFVEGFRAMVAVPRYSLARPPALPAEPDDPSGGKKKKKRRDYYLFWRFCHWLQSLRVPLLTWFDTFINLIQGKNQTMTRVFADTIIEQQRNLVQVAHSIRADLTRLIEQKLMDQQRSAATRFTASTVRVAISVLSADQSNVFYISQSHGSANLGFIKRSVAWVSVFTGNIRWYEDKFKTEFGDKYNQIVLLDNSTGTIADDEKQILLASHYQPRNEDYEAFVVFPVPWPQRGEKSDYVKGAIHISFRKQIDFENIWGYHPPKATTPDGSPEYPPGDGMLETAIPAPVVAPTPSAMPTAAPTAPVIPTTPPPAPSAIAAASAPGAPPAPMVAPAAKPDEPDGWCKYAEICVALNNSMAILGELLRGFNEVIYKSYIEPNPRD